MVCGARHKARRAERGRRVNATPHALKVTLKQQKQRKRCYRADRNSNKHILISCLTEVRTPVLAEGLFVTRGMQRVGCHSSRAGGSRSKPLSNAPALVVGQRSKDALGSPISRIVCIRHSRQTTARDGSIVAFGGSMNHPCKNHSDNSIVCKWNNGRGL